MRDHLYIWHDPQQQYLVASGLEFRDFLPTLTKQGGVLLIDHQSDTARYDTGSGFTFSSRSNLSKLAAEDIYSWGNFVWVDYAMAELPFVTDDDVAELLFFSHKTKPLYTAAFPRLRNAFLGYVHDDGWYLKFYYTSWSLVAQFLTGAVPASLGRLDISELGRGSQGFWLAGGDVHSEEKTHDVDAVLNRRL